MGFSGGFYQVIGPETIRWPNIYIENQQSKPQISFKISFLPQIRKKEKPQILEK